MAKLIVLVVMWLTATSCALFRSSDGVDISAAADRVALLRADVQALTPLASPETQQKLAEFTIGLGELEAALRAADGGAPMDDALDYARALLAIADHLATALPPENDLRLAIVIGRIVLNHLAAGQVQKAAEVHA